MITKPVLFTEKTGSPDMFSRLISFFAKCSPLLSMDCISSMPKFTSFSHFNIAEIRVSLKVNSILVLSFVGFFFSVTATHRTMVHHLDTMKYMSTIYIHVCIHVLYMYSIYVCVYLALEQCRELWALTLPTLKKSKRRDILVV